MRPDRHHLRRAGFSLIEVLVSITIMVIVISFIVSFLGTTGSAAREASTRATIAKLDSLLQARFRQMVDSFNDQERKSLIRNEWTNITYAASQYLGGSEPAAAKKAFVKLNRYRGAFPQRSGDFGILGGSDVNPNASLWPASVPASHTAATESIELLYLILSKGGGTGAEAQIADSINPRHIKDTDGDGLMEFVDDWGNPLRFYLSPTRLIRPGGPYTLPTSQQYSLAKSLIATIPPLPSSATDFTSLFNQDPLDPRGALRLTNPFPASPGTGDRHFYNPIATFEQNYHTPDTWFAPLIVSCGADEALGLEDPTAASANRHAFVLNADEVGDNITNLQTGGGRP